LNLFGDALQKAGILPGPDGYDKKKAASFTLEMKLLEMKNHVSALERMYEKYLASEGQDQFDIMDGLANRFGYMVIAFQDVMTTIGRLTGTVNCAEQLSIRRAISEFQSIFEVECREQGLDNGVSSMADRNEIVHVYENYKSNMEVVLENVQNYRNEYGVIIRLLWEYCKAKDILQK